MVGLRHKDLGLFITEVIVSPSLVGMKTLTPTRGSLINTKDPQLLPMKSLVIIVQCEAKPPNGCLWWGNQDRIIPRKAAPFGQLPLT